jgi:hypothetical protein
MKMPAQTTSSVHHFLSMSVPPFQAKLHHQHRPAIR